MAVVDLVVGKLTEFTVETVGRHFSYLICYRRNIKDLKEKIEKLGHIRTGVVQQVEEFKRNSQVIGPDVLQWQENVDETSKRVMSFLGGEEGVNDKCWNGWCLNPKSCYLLGRKAKKMILEVVELQEAGKFDKIAYTRSPPKLGPSFAPGIKDLLSRQLMLTEVLEALKDDKISEIGICGMPGVGKTRMVKQIVKEVEGGVVFDEVAVAVMSQNPNWRKIQDEIASRLGLKFDEESLLGRAAELCRRIMNSDKRILIILDDAWEKPDFEAIGLPFGGDRKGYKIVLTSRNQNICEHTNDRKIFIIKVLSDDEGWDLFQETLGDSVDNPDLLRIAKEIAKECGGLPIAIVTVAKALLKDKSINIWENALLELRKRVQSVLGPAYSCIELSYNYLAREETKSCFLLCCLFPEDWNISPQFLVDYGFGLGLFEGVENLKQARNRVDALLSDLKASFLLLDGDDYQSVKMHDLVRDVAISIASKDKNEFLVRHEAVMKRWPQTGRYKYYTAISLCYGKINEHPNDLDCPKLELLQLMREKGKFADLPAVPDNFFEGLKALKVLYMEDQSILPQSLQLLKNLITLLLYGYKLEGLSTIGALEKLEIFRIDIDSLTKLPREFGQLTSLLLLDLSGCSRLEYIPPDVLSRLSKLEELYIPLSFKNWDTEIQEEGEDARKIVNASICELESLQLTVLEVWVADASLLWLKESFFRNLKTFKIILGSRHSVDWKSYQGNCLRLDGNYNDFQKCGFYVLGNKTEVLELKVNNLKNIQPNLDEVCSPHLKVLDVSNCNELEYIVDGTKHIRQSTAISQLDKLYLRNLSNLKEIWHKQLPMSYCFGNLRELYVNDCIKLKFVCTLSMARCLCQLRKLSINGCLNMEGVLLIRNEEDSKMISNEIFLKLENLNLQRLPKLFCFCVSINNAVPQSTPPNQKDVDKGFEELSAFESIKMRPTLFSTPCPRLPSLNRLRLWDCGLLQAVFSPSIVSQFGQLEVLGVHDCDSMEYIVLGEEEEGKNKEKIIAKQIIEEEEEEHDARSDKIVFPQLRSLRILYLIDLKCFYGGSQALELPSLQQMDYISDCMETFSIGALSTPMLEEITLNYTNHESYLLREGDLNATIQHLCKTLYKVGDSRVLEEASSSTN